MKKHFPHPPAQRQYGFSLMELSLVLVVIGLIIGSVAIGRDLQRNASYQRLSTDFVQGWVLAYDAYLNGTGRPPRDSATDPSGRVNNGTNELCGTNLLNAFLAVGVRLPEGRAEGSNDRYAYLDSNGNPQEVQVCFQNVPWAEPGATVGAYDNRPRNVMVLKNLTFALAGFLDQQIDGKVDARFGRMRESGKADVTTSAAISAAQAWSKDERMAIGSTTVTARDEDQVAVMNAYVQMTR